LKNLFSDKWGNLWEPNVGNKLLISLLRGQEWRNQHFPLNHTHPFKVVALRNIFFGDASEVIHMWIYFRFFSEMFQCFRFFSELFHYDFIMKIKGSFWMCSHICSNSENKTCWAWLTQSRTVPLQVLASLELIHKCRGPNTC
jgi:hypothetical protein